MEPSARQSGVTEPRNPPWSREELLLALELYLRNREAPPGKTSEQVLKLSQELNQLRSCIGTKGNGTFRNASGVYLKMMNFRSLDPDYLAKGKVGMTHRNKLEETVWNEYFQRQNELLRVCRAIREGVAEITVSLQETDVVDEFPAANEGRLLPRLHQLRERNPKLVNEKKKRAMRQNGCLRCEACNFDFAQRYGKRGEWFIECHHTTPLRDYDSGQKTTLADLALICANCHRIIHSRSPWLSMDELRALLDANKLNYAGSY